jgi:hypothetical protein
MEDARHEQKLAGEHKLGRLVAEITILSATDSACARATGGILEVEEAPREVIARDAAKSRWYLLGRCAHYKRFWRFNDVTSGEPDLAVATPSAAHRLCQPRASARETALVLRAWRAAPHTFELTRSKEHRSLGQGQRISDSSRERAGRGRWRGEFFGAVVLGLLADCG